MFNLLSRIVEMSILKLVRTNLIYLRKEAISTSLSLKCAEHHPTEEEKVDPKIDFEQRVQTSIRYLKSDAYKETYGEDPVWTQYVRNYKGNRPRDTRRDCWAFGRLNKGSPCPICRDEYLVLDFKNVDLLKQFISPYGGEVLPTRKTGICQKQFQNLLVAIRKAKDYGLIKFDIPHRLYDYTLYNRKGNI